MNQEHPRKGPNGDGHKRRLWFVTVAFASAAVVTANLVPQCVPACLDGESSPGDRMSEAMVDPECPIVGEDLDLVLIPAELHPWNPPLTTPEPQELLVNPSEDDVFLAQVGPSVEEATVRSRGGLLSLADFLLRKDPPPVAQPVESTKRSVRTHQVERAETLAEIARRHDVDAQFLARVNRVSTHKQLAPGTTVFIPDGEGLVVTVGQGDSLWLLCNRYRVQLGRALEANELDDPADLQVGQRIFLPEAKEPVQVAVRQFIWPIQGRFTSGFGYRKNPMGGNEATFHAGIDLAANRGVAIRAARSGIVQFADWQGAMGRTIVIAHDSGYSTVYGHCSHIVVRPGQRVEQGQVIGQVGNTGRSTGSHLHFEIRKNNRPVDPLKLLPKRPAPRQSADLAGIQG